MPVLFTVRLEKLYRREVMRGISRKKTAPMMKGRMKKYPRRLRLRSQDTMRLAIYCAPPFTSRHAPAGIVRPSACCWVPL